MLKAAVISGLVLAVVSVSGCKPTEPPVDIIKTQRDALNKAKAVEGQLKQTQERTKAAEEEQK